MSTNEARAMKRDYLPLLLIPALALVALPLVGSPSSWVTLTVAGLAMGLMIFIMASGLTLTFGLMDVLNFGHGAGVRHLAVVHHGHGVAQLTREGEVLLDHQQRRLAVLQFAEGRDHVGDDGGRQALGRLVN